MSAHPSKVLATRKIMYHWWGKQKTVEFRVECSWRGLWVVPSQGPFRITATQALQEKGKSEWCVGVSRTSFIDTKRYPVCVQEGEGIPPSHEVGSLLWSCVAVTVFTLYWRQYQSNLIWSLESTKVFLQKF